VRHDHRRTQVLTFARSRALRQCIDEVVRAQVLRSGFTAPRRPAIAAKIFGFAPLRPSPLVTPTIDTRLLHPDGV
jgi:hypothetical protein